MAIVKMKDLLLPALNGKYAVGAFEFWSLDSAQAVIEAAEEAHCPVILQAGPLECKYAGINNLAKIARMAAEKASISVALHLDHGDTLQLVQDALDNGFTSVMIDASSESFDTNVEMTQKTVEMARKTGATVEGELGRIPGGEANIPADVEEYYTIPEEAVKYAEKTGVDALAVAIGSAHGFYTKEPRLDIRRLREIYDLVRMPIVLHGGTGIDAAQIKESIQNGIAKVNICTEFVAAFGRQYTATQNRPGFKYAVPSLFEPSKQAGKAVALEKIKLFKAGQL